MTLDHAPIVSAEDGDCDQPIATDAVADARRRYARANSRWLSGLATLPMRDLEALDLELDDAARTLHRMGVTL